MPNIEGQTLYSALTDALIRVNLPLTDCRGQAYDGAQNMQGKVKGVGSRITSDYPSALGTLSKFVLTRYCTYFQTSSRCRGFGI